MTTIYTLEVVGYSDDIISLEIFEHNGLIKKTLFENEFGTDNIFKINDHIAIITKWMNSFGHTIGFANLNEDIILDERYAVRYDLSNAHHSPTIVVTSKYPFTIAGIYGDIEADLRDRLEGLHDINTDSVIKIVKNLKLI